FYARQIADDQGRPVPFWRANHEVADSRLQPDKSDRTTWQFPAADTARVRVRLLYRRFYKSVADAKQWPENEIVIFDKALGLPGSDVVWSLPRRRLQRHLPRRSRIQIQPSSGARRRQERERSLRPRSAGNA